MSNEKEGIEPINDGATKGVDGRRASKKKPKVKADYQIDIRAALEAPVRIKRDGGITSVDSYEAMLRQNVRKSLVSEVRHLDEARARRSREAQAHQGAA
jgi:ASC-1-like (ASCH) protein